MTLLVLLPQLFAAVKLSIYISPLPYEPESCHAQLGSHSSAALQYAAPYPPAHPYWQESVVATLLGQCTSVFSLAQCISHFSTNEQPVWLVHSEVEKPEQDFGLGVTVE